MPPPLLPEYVPQEVDLFIERSNLNGLILAGVAYGVLFTIFVQCVQLILRVYTPTMNSGSGAGLANLRRPPWLIFYTVAMFVLATVGFGANTKFIQMTYIDYRNFPGGPNAFTGAFYSHPINMASFVSYVLMSWLADGLVLYRYTLLYNYQLWAVAFPAAIYMGVIAMSCCLIAAIKSEEDFWAQKAINFGIAYWSLSIGLNILLTMLIAGRLISMRTKIREVLGKQHSSPYISVMSMMIESAALYSIWGLVFLILFARNEPAQNIVLPALGQIQGIAPLLIIFRVGQGKAWSRDTITAMRGTSNIMIAPGGTSHGGSRTVLGNGTNNYPLTDVSSSGKVAIHQSTTVTRDGDSEEWADEGKRGHSINAH